MKPLVALFLAASYAQTDIPMTLVSEDESEPIHSAIVRKEAWTQDPVRRLRVEADKRMREGPWTVTSDRPKDLTLDVHEYYSEAPYYWPDPDNPSGAYIRKDGQTNPARFTANRNALVAMSDTVFTLGTAALLLDNQAYGKRAASVIHTWFINPKTRMNPDLDYAQSIPRAVKEHGSPMTDGRPFIRAIQGMEFLAHTGAWDPREEAAVRGWFEEYLHWLTTSQTADDEKKSGDNRASWWTAQVAAVASFTGDAKTAQMAFSYYRDRIFPRQIRPDGSAPREEVRTFSLSLSISNLEAFTTVCRIAQLRGNTDLWNIHGRRGANISTVIDYLAPALEDPKKWTKGQAAEIPGENLSFLAFAGMGLNQPEYIALYRKVERSDSPWLSLVDLLVGRFEAAAHQTRH